MSEPEVVSDLTPVGILYFLKPAELEPLKFYGIFGEFATGETVIKEGAVQDRLYFVISGRLQVAVASAGSEIILGELGPGDCFGEVSIFEPGPASATVRVLETAVLWHIDVLSLQQYFEQLPEAGGQLMTGIARLLCRRLRQANAAIVANRMPPRHLSLRGGSLRAPITAHNVAVEKGGLFSGLFGKKK